MRIAIVSAFALIAATPLEAQVLSDLSAITPIDGNWTYAATPEGSDATFANASGSPQLFVHCTKATRRVSISKPASSAAPTISIWTSSLTRSVPSSFNPAAARLTVDLSNYDPLLDAIATSRGRIGFSVGNDSALVLPAWAEAAHVIEDCRA
jgi:hypothetical protein